jgi:hypothetical protein
MSRLVPNTQETGLLKQKEEQPWIGAVLGFDKLALIVLES